MMTQNGFKSLLTSLLLIGLLFSSSMAEARGFALGGKVSTLGVGLEGTVGLLPGLNLRALVNGFSFDTDMRIWDIDYDLGIDLRSAPIMLDWHPFRDGGFRVSGGAVLNQNQADAKASPSGSYVIGDTEYDARNVGTLRGKIDFNDVAPYVGIGWGNALSKDKRWSFSCDLGVVLQNEANVELSASGPIADDPVFQTNLAQEERDFEGELKDYKYYPFVSVGFTYKF